MASPLLTSSDRNARVRTGVPGLDVVLSGGLLPGSTAIIQGPPGSGKTVFANQIAFSQLREDKTAVYVTLLAESHTRLLRHLQSLTFYDKSFVGDRIVYLSAFHSVHTSVSALSDLLQKELIGRRPSLLVVEGITAISDLHGGMSCREFLHQLQTATEAANCTTLVISTNLASPSLEDAVVDSVLSLTQSEVGIQPVRELEVIKTRGTPHLSGRHTFVIDDQGVTVFPRIEAVYRMPSQQAPDNDDRLGFGDRQLDAMAGGGVRAGTTTLLLGATGTGKTLLGLSFLAAGLREGQKVAYSGFFESPERLIAAGEGIGLRLNDGVQSGRFHVDWTPPVELYVDAWAARLLRMVRDLQPRRLFIDGLSAIQGGTAHPERVPAFLTALSNQLRALNVTTAIAGEMHPILDRSVDVPLPGVSPIVENTILLRYADEGTRFSRRISVLKMRGGGHDNAIREFAISGAGLRLLPLKSGPTSARTARRPSRTGRTKP